MPSNEVFKKAKPSYSDALNKRGFKEKLSNTPEVDGLDSAKLKIAVIFLAVNKVVFYGIIIS